MLADDTKGRDGDTRSEACRYAAQLDFLVSGNGSRHPAITLDESDARDLADVLRTLVMDLYRAEGELREMEAVIS